MQVSEQTGCQTFQQVKCSPPVRLNFDQTHLSIQTRSMKTWSFTMGSKRTS
jgi:hypothetical protein